MIDMLEWGMLFVVLWVILIGMVGSVFANIDEILKNHERLIFILRDEINYLKFDDNDQERRI